MEERTGVKQQWTLTWKEAHGETAQGELSASPSAIMTRVVKSKWVYAYFADKM